MSKRRTFISTTATAAIALLSLNSATRKALGGQKLKKIGFISGIVEKELQKDWKAILKTAVEYGYSEIEAGSYLGDSASEFLSYCKNIGIRHFAGFIQFTENVDELHKNLDMLTATQVNYAVTYWPWKTGGPFKLEDCKKSVEILNIMGEACQKAGLELCWHNHNKEFITMEEGLPFDYLMNNTDKDTVKCEMDIYWVVKGGADPLALLKKYSGRFRILHVKDMAAGPAQDFECPGSGIIDFPSIFKEALHQGIDHYIVERDNALDGMACLKSSATYLHNLTI